MALAGDSAGGTIAIVTALLTAMDIRLLILLYPVTDANFETLTYRHFEDGPWLTKASMEWFWNAYEPDVEKRSRYTVCPLRASVKQLTGLCPTLIITDENDVLRSEGEAFAHKLMEANVDVTAVRFLGTIHDFMMLNALAKTPAARTAIDLVNLKIAQYL